LLAGSTVLHLLAYNKNKRGTRLAPDLIDELYAKAVRLMTDLIDHKNEKGLTALHCACAQGNAAMAVVLMRGGCSVWGEHKGQS
jgi:ankyrin repeat protein